MNIYESRAYNPALSMDHPCSFDVGDVTPHNEKPVLVYPYGCEVTRIAGTVDNRSALDQNIHTNPQL